MKIQHDIDLYHYNTFGIKANCKLFATVKSTSDIKKLIEMDVEPSLPRLVLGEGSNILFTQDYQGLIIKSELKGIHVLDETENDVLLKVAAGENWHQFVSYCVEQGFGGIENLSLIPGTVGAAPIQNIGAYGVELKDVLERVEAVHLATGQCVEFPKEQCQFGYRTSIFKTHYKNQLFITYIYLKLQKNPTYQLHYAALRNALGSKNPVELSLKLISQTVMDIRSAKLPDPREIGNAGSFFKNPVISLNQFTDLQKQHPDIPFYPEDSPNQVKIPAAWLIEKAGWKGKKLGNVGVHNYQALVLVNYGGGAGEDILKLAKDIQLSVEDQFGIQLTPEVNII